MLRRCHCRIVHAIKETLLDARVAISAKSQCNNNDASRVWDPHVVGDDDASIHGFTRLTHSPVDRSFVGDLLDPSRLRPMVLFPSFEMPC